MKNLGLNCYHHLRISAVKLKRLLSILVLASGFLCIQTTLVSALEVATHRQLNEWAATQNIAGFSLDEKLRDQLGLKEGVEEIIDEKQIFRWIGDGGAFEDNPSNLPVLGRAINLFLHRYVNHFHNPLLPWNQAGFSGIVGGLSLSGESSILWAQKPVGTQSLFGDWSWRDAQNYFYNGLTNPDKNTREDNLAKTFRSVGQHMHLVQDLSVPAHTRDDAHVFYSYEKWLAKQQKKDSNKISEFDKLIGLTPIVFDPSVLLFSPDALAPVPIARISDTDQYFTTMFPDPTVTLGTKIGLAEYVNANFFSKDTILTPEFPYPTWSSVEEYDETIDVATGKKRTYLRKIADGETIEHAAAARWFYKYLPVGYKRLGLKLDEAVYGDYAPLLVPRAVGYSAGLLNYFFRGKMRVFGTQAGLRIMNISDEIMNVYDDPVTGLPVGSIEIYYDDTSNQRHLLATYDLPGPIAPNQGTPVIPIIPPSDNDVPDQYMVVFRGKLGAEEGAVIGQIFQRGIYYVGEENGFQKIFRINLDGSNRTLILENLKPNLTFGKLSLSPTSTDIAFTISLPAVSPVIHTMDLVGGPSTFLTVGEWPDWSPDGSLIALQKDTGRSTSFMDIEIHIINPVTGVETILTNSDFSRGALNIGHPNWSPDGASLSVTDEFFAGVKEDDCWNQFVVIVIPASGELTTGTRSCSQRPLAMDEFPVHDGAATWRPDGTELAFTRQRNMIDPPPLGTFLGDELYKLQIGTITGQTKLTDSTGLDFKELTPDWSPDGRNIAISSNRDGDFDIWLVDPNGGGYLTNLTKSNSGTDSFPAFGWAPE